jgi:DNA-binding NtrC family response regulator
MPHVTLLVVDDDPALLRTFARTFGKRHEVLAAESGADALHVLRARAIDVALVDYAMPAMSGVDLLRRMAVIHPDVGRVLLTAYADLPELAELKGAQLVSAILAKPWDVAEVDAAIARTFQLVTMRRAVRDMRSGVGPVE